ncbi:MAG: glycosyltransferase, partial [Planctomycetes bacterium]|nr:glycosyltransferase [Planctomycetota bacterium]
MNICHVITRLILGGAQENTILTCEGLHQAGHNVTLVTGPA